MVSVESQMLELGTKALDFELNDVVSNKKMKLDDLRGIKGTLIFFISNHCPYVIHIRDHFNSLYEDYSNNISFIAINSNDVDAYPRDNPENMKNLAEEKNWQFPFLFDSSQDVAKSYKAACTPDFYLFDNELKLFYRGQLDGSRPKNNIPVTGKDLRRAIDLLLAEKNPPEEQFPSIGCNIKWKPGSTPDYFG